MESSLLTRQRWSRPNPLWPLFQLPSHWFFTCGLWIYGIQSVGTESGKWRGRAVDGPRTLIPSPNWKARWTVWFLWRHHPEVAPNPFLAHLATCPGRDYSLSKPMKWKRPSYCTGQGWPAPRYSLFLPPGIFPWVTPQNFHEQELR